jgi:hypothetical protein
MSSLAPAKTELFGNGYREVALPAKNSRSIGVMECWINDKSQNSMTKTVLRF